MDPHVGTGPGDLNDQYDRLMNEKVQICDSTGQPKAVTLRDFATLTGKGSGLTGKVVRAFQRRKPLAGASPDGVKVAPVSHLIESFHKIAEQYQKIGNQPSTGAGMDPAKVVSQNLENAKKLENLSRTIKKYVEETSSENPLSTQDLKKIEAADQLIGSKSENLETAKNFTAYLNGLDPYDVLFGSDDDENCGQHEPLRFAFHYFMIFKRNAPDEPYTEANLKKDFQDFVTDLLQKVAKGEADPQLIHNINETKKARVITQVKRLVRKPNDLDKKLLLSETNREYRKLRRLCFSSASPLLNHFGVSYDRAARTALALAENNQFNNRNFARDIGKLMRVDPKRLTRALCYDRSIESLLAIPPDQRTPKQKEILDLAQRPENISTKARTMGDAYAGLVTGNEAISYSLMNFLHHSLGFEMLAEQLCADLPEKPLDLLVEGEAESFAIQELTAGMTEVQRIGSRDRVIAFANGFSSSQGPEASEYAEAMEYATKDGGKIMLLSGAESTRGRKAAANANAGFLTTVSNGLREKNAPQTFRQLGQLSIAGVQAAHKTITENTKNGLATHCSVVTKLDAKGRGTAIATSVGDMTVLVRRANGTVEAIAKRNNRDGHLGAHFSPKANYENGPDYPQLSNLTVYQFELRPGDTVALLSPRVSDQLDPEKNGFNNPNDVRDFLLKNRALLQTGDAAFLNNLGQLPTTWDVMNANATVLKEIYATYKSKVVANAHPDKPFVEALTQHAFESTSKNMRGYGMQFTSNANKKVSPPASVKKVRFSPEANVRVLYQATAEEVKGRKRETFDDYTIKAVDYGRSATQKELHAQNISRRVDFQDSATAQVESENFEPHILHVEFEKLREKVFSTISLDQIHDACIQKLFKMRTPQSEDEIKRVRFEAKFIAEQLTTLVASMPNKLISTLDLLKSFLKNKISAKNKNTEQLDTETFKLLADAEFDRNLVRTLSDTAEYENAVRHLTTGDDSPGIAGEFTTYEIPQESLKRWNDLIDSFFNEVDVATVLANFLPDGGEQFRQDVLNRERAVITAESNSVAQFKDVFLKQFRVDEFKARWSAIETLADYRKDKVVNELTNLYFDIIQQLEEKMNDEPAKVAAKREIYNDLMQFFNGNTTNNAVGETP